MRGLKYIIYPITFLTLMFLLSDIAFTIRNIILLVLASLGFGSAILKLYDLYK
ncbi:Uncharacterised protein [Streptococcus acidominimus]|uniref:Uncharacterized protein n=1 Tax=Streptococcus acidominimus TaxID=1326 RepID=A0A239XKZ7_STRAI|nr:Uncharacterised protein [Streptococcus acidominimus]